MSNLTHREYLINVFRDTIIYAREISSRFTESIKINIDDIILRKTKQKYNPVIIVVNQDIIRTILDEPERCLVLNLACFYIAGGGVVKGSMAQEEEIARKTDYMLHSYRGIYPLKLNEIVFTSNVKILKDENYNKINKSFIKEFDMLAVAAIKNPKLINNKFSYEDRNITYRKIESIFKFAILYNYEIIILGALGCGAYHNPVEEIIEIFNECIIKYGNNFKKIIFSVYSQRDRIIPNNFNLFNNLIIKSI